MSLENLCAPEYAESLLESIVDPCSIAAGSAASIVALGLVRRLRVHATESGHWAVTVELRLTGPSCLLGPAFCKSAQDALLAGGYAEAVVTLASDFDWMPQDMRPELRARSASQQLARLKRGLRVGIISAGVLSVTCGQGLAPVAAAEDTFEEVVVTAQKRAQSSQEVPVTMDAYSAKDLEQRAVVSASDLAQFTPGLTIGGSAAGQTLLFGVRGVVQQDFAGHAESPVATYIDDGYVATNSIAGIGMFDMARAEVLKGPQGTLFGRNATGGVVSLYSNMPSAVPEGYVDAEYGSYSSYRIEGAAGGPLAPGVNGRLAAVYNYNSAWVENQSPRGNDLGNDRDYAARARLQIRPSDGVEVLLTGVASRAYYSWGPYFDLSTRFVTNNQGLPIDAVIVNEPTLLGTAASDFKHLRVNAGSARSTGGKSHLNGGTARINWDFGPVVTLITDIKDSAYTVVVDNDASPVDWINSENNVFTKSLSQEARISGKLSRLRLTGGVYYLHIRAGMDPNRDWIYPASAIIEDIYELKTNSTSAFGEVEYDLAPRTTVIAGGRITDEKKDYRYRSEALTLDSTYIGPARTPYADSFSNTLVTARLVFQYQANKDLLLYAGWNRGAKAGSFNAPFAGGTAYPDSAIPYRPEKLDAFEAGEKWTLAQGRARLNSALYYYNYKDYQAYRLVNLSTQVTNNPAKSYGGEVSLAVKPATALTLEGSASYVHNRVSGVDLGGPALVTREAPYTSDWKANVLARYEIPFASGSLGLQGDVSYTGDYFFSLTNYQATHVPNYTLLNARIGWVDASGSWDISVRGENLTDRRYENVGFELSGLCGCTEVGVGKPRWFTFAVRKRF